MHCPSPRRYSTPTIWLHTFCTLLSLACIIVAYTFMCLARKNNDNIADNHTDVVISWHNDLVYGLTNNPNINIDRSRYYLQSWTGSFPANEEGCHCPPDLVLKDKCSSAHERSGCTDIPKKDKVDLIKWINGQTIYTIRAKGTAFIDNYLKIAVDGKCSPGYRHCGDVKSISKGVCIPDVYPCPITNISTSPIVSSTLQSTSVTLSGLTLYTLSDPTANPIADLYIREHHLCTVRNHIALTPGTQPYKLFHEEDFTDCLPDPAAWWVSELPESTFLSLNAIPPDYLPSLRFSDQRMYRLLLAPMLEWSPLCSDTVRTMASKGSDIHSLQFQMDVLFVLFTLSLCLTGLHSLSLIYTTYYDQNTRSIYRVFLVVKTIAFLLILPSLIVVTVRSHSFHFYFQDIGRLHCTAPANQGVFTSISDDFDAKVHSRLLTMSILVFLSFHLDLFSAFLFLFWFETPRRRRHRLEIDSLYKSINQVLPILQNKVQPSQSEHNQPENNNNNLSPSNNNSNEGNNATAANPIPAVSTPSENIDLPPTTHGIPPPPLPAVKIDRGERMD